MRVVMVLISGRGHFAALILGSTVVAVFMAVMPEMYRVVRQMLQRNANATRSRVSRVQRQHDGKKKCEAGAHTWRSI